MIDDKRKQLVDNIRIAIADAGNEKEVLERTIELLDSFSAEFNWTGFYMMKGRTLEVGPYVGEKTEHTQIDLESGICGAAASQKKTIIVDDVNSDPRHIACSLSTRSEIVVPLMDGTKCLGEIDIDSNRPANFSRSDQEMLETVAKLVVTRLTRVR